MHRDRSIYTTGFGFFDQRSPIDFFYLHYGDYRSKLVPFEEQKNIFYILKRL
jgi:hypothetical protein